MKARYKKPELCEDASSTDMSIIKMDQGSIFEVEVHDENQFWIPKDGWLMQKIHCEVVEDDEIVDASYHEVESEEEKIDNMMDSLRKTSTLKETLEEMNVNQGPSHFVTIDKLRINPSKIDFYHIHEYMTEKTVMGIGGKEFTLNVELEQVDMILATHRRTEV